MILSQHFTLEEMVRSQTAVRKGIANEPEQAHIENLARLCQYVLEPVRAHFGKPVTITSGYRCARLNKAVGGSATSQHCFGEAADFHVPGVPDLVVAQWIHANLVYDQLILEYPPEGWVHVSLSGTRNRKQDLTCKRISGKVKYIPGFHP